MMGSDSGVDVDLSEPEVQVALRRAFDRAIVHPGFGLGWREIPPPTLRAPKAMSAIDAFVATNGWQMVTGGLLFSYGPVPSQPLRGLPWKEIHDRSYSATTHNEILYVVLSGWHHDWHGVAYNPRTNAFAPAISGFRPLGSHWYAWVQAEFPHPPLEQRYEGQLTNNFPTVRH